MLRVDSSQVHNSVLYGHPPMPTKVNSLLAGSISSGILLSLNTFQSAMLYRI